MSVLGTTFGILAATQDRAHAAKTDATIATVAFVGSAAFTLVIGEVVTGTVCPTGLHKRQEFEVWHNNLRLCHADQLRRRRWPRELSRLDPASQIENTQAVEMVS